MQEKIHMVDLAGQHRKIEAQVYDAINATIERTSFINGPEVSAFEKQLATYLEVNYVIPCANGTDALQIAMMALDLKPGDEVIVPAFTYVATAEVIALLQLVPVMVDVDPDTFNTTAELIEKAITPKTKAIVPVHLFGQSADMEPIMELAAKYNLKVIEDTAQAIGAVYTFKNGSKQRAGAIGHIGCTSFFPSKNLGCYGDGGALYTNDEDLALRIKKIANHGQAKKYEHELVGVNSRLDSIQAAILAIKLGHLDAYEQARNKAAHYYDKAFSNLIGIQIPKRQANSTHVFHQYTLQVQGDRNALKAYLESKNIPSMVYYPIPLHHQQAYQTPRYPKGSFPVAEKLAASVLSLPMHTELTEQQLEYISTAVKTFLKQN